MNKKKSIRTRLNIAFAGLAILPLLLLGLVLACYNFSVQKNQVNELQREVTQLTARGIGVFFNQVEQRLIAHVKENNYSQLADDQVASRLRTFMDVSVDDSKGRLFDEVAVVSRNGMARVRVSQTSLVQRPAHSNYIRKDEFAVPAKSGESYYGPMRLNKKTGEPVMNMSVPFLDENGEFAGVLVAELRLKLLWNLMTDVRLGDTGSVFVLDEGGYIVAHADPEVVASHIQVQLVPDGYMKGHTGELVLVAHETLGIGGAKLVVVTEYPVVEAFSSFFNTAMIIAAFIILTLYSALALKAKVIREVVEPIESLVSAAGEVGDGKGVIAGDKRRDDELGELATAYENLTDQLSDSMEIAQREKNFIQDAIESLYYPFVVYDAKDHGVLFSNSAAKAGTNLANSQSSSQGEAPRICISIPHTLQKVIETCQPVVINYTERDANCLPGDYEVHGHPVFDDDGNVVRVIEYIIDVTEKSVLEAQLRQAQKLEALGSLAGGVAHDFNNLLSAIMGYAELALEQVSNESVSEDLNSIYEAGSRGAKLTKQLLAFSRKQDLECIAVNFNDIVCGIENILRTMIGESVRLDISLEDKLRNIDADPGQMDQVIMNLAVNARDAMPKGGTLKVETANVVLDEEVSLFNEGVRPGLYALLQVKDTGVGVSDDIKDKIFDPFFTTKGEKGTGLGLATVYGIVKQHEGFIDISSEIGKGTTFSIYLPALNHEPTAVDTEHASPQDFRGNEGILLVDDDGQIVDLLGQVIEKLGYKVYRASSGKEAAELCKTYADSIDLLLTDVIMPGVDGVELAKTFKSNVKDGKIIYMSGYAPELIQRRGAVASGTHFIQKPVRFKDVGRRLRMVLDEK